MRRKIEKIRSVLKGKKKGMFFAITFLVLCVLINPFKKVEVGENAIIFNSLNNSISDNIQPGWHFVIPFIQKMTVYPINEQTYKIYRDNKSWSNGVDASITTPTNDNQKVSIDITFVYTLMPKKLNYIFKKFNGDDVKNIEQKYLDDILKNAVISIVSKYSAYEVYSTKRVEIQNRISTEVKQKIAINGLEMKYIYLDNVRLSEEVESIIKAQALAEAAIIEAKGKSDANKLLSNSLNDKIMTYEALGKLSESLKLIVVPSGSGSELDFSKILEQVVNQNENTAE